MGTLLNIKQMAEILGIDEGTLYRKVEEGIIPCKRLGGVGRGAIRFDPEEVNEAISEKEKEEVN